MHIVKLQHVNMQSSFSEIKIFTIFKKIDNKFKKTRAINQDTIRLNK